MKAEKNSSLVFCLQVLISGIKESKLFLVYPTFSAYLPLISEYSIIKSDLLHWIDRHI